MFDLSRVSITTGYLVVLMPPPFNCDCYCVLSISNTGELSHIVYFCHLVEAATSVSIKFASLCRYMYVLSFILLCSLKMRM